MNAGFLDTIKGATYLYCQNYLGQTNYLLAGVTKPAKNGSSCIPKFVSIFPKGIPPHGLFVNKTPAV